MKPKVLKQGRIPMEGNKTDLYVNLHPIDGFFPLHWQSFFSIEIVLEGTGVYSVNDVRYDVGTYKAFLMTPTDFHYLDFDGHALLFNIGFVESTLPERDLAALIAENRQTAYALTDEEYKRLVSAAELLRDEYEKNGDCKFSLLQYVVRMLLRKNPEKPKKTYFTGIQRAIAFTELHFKEQISLEDVATEAGYTPAYFSRLFKQTTGESYSHTLTRYRLGFAKSLLANGFSVTDACFSSGFGSTSNFLEAFKKFEGLSPSEYKKQFAR